MMYQQTYGKNYNLFSNTMNNNNYYTNIYGNNIYNNSNISEVPNITNISGIPNMSNLNNYGSNMNIQPQVMPINMGNNFSNSYVNKSFTLPTNNEFNSKSENSNKLDQPSYTKQSNIAINNIKNVQLYLSPYTYPNNPNNFHARYFVLKSIDEDNILKSIKYSVWSSTQKGNAKLNKIYKDSLNKYPVYLFFSVNCSGKFLGIARMDSEIDTNLNFPECKRTDKWKGYFKLHWLIIKDIPNKYFKNLSNSLNDNKCVISSRDTQEIEKKSGDYMMQISINYPYESSIIDDVGKDINLSENSTFVNLTKETRPKSNLENIEKEVIYDQSRQIYNNQDFNADNISLNNNNNSKVNNALDSKLFNRENFVNEANFKVNENILSRKDVNGVNVSSNSSTSKKKSQKLSKKYIEDSI